MLAQILTALGALRTEEQEVVALCDWAGLSYMEAATATDVPSGLFAPGSPVPMSIVVLGSATRPKRDGPNGTVAVYRHPEGEW